jgi:hypothetical protein
MPSIPNPKRFAQGHRRDVTRALTLARQLTPMQRHLLVRAGLPHWLNLPVPWQPLPGRQVAAAQALVSAEFGLLEPLPTFQGAYQLTPLGELVAGIWLRDAVMGGSHHCS